MRWIGLTAALMTAVSGQALAQAAEPAGAAQASTGVISYPPSFFAESRPNTAMDMINRLPGFTFEGGDQARGFAGTAGNVLIDGQRPTAKTDSLSDFLARIPASQVERIDLIRGGAPGIDMQGRTVVANVIRKRQDNFQQTVSASGHFFTETGRILPGWRYEVSKRSGDRLFDAAITRGVGMDDSVGHGKRFIRDPNGVVLVNDDVLTEADSAPHSIKASYKTPLAGGTFRINGTVGTNPWKEEDSFYSGGDRTYVWGSQTGLNGEIGVNYTRKLTDRLELEALTLQKLGESEFVSTYTDGTDEAVFVSEAETGESIGRAVLKFVQSDKLQYEAGGEAAFNFREGHVAYSENGSTIPLPNPDVRVEELRGEAFGQATWRPTAKLTLEAGSRFEQSTITQSGTTDRERSFFYAKPRAVVSWSPNEQTQLRLRVEREVGQLNFGDFASSANLSAGTFTTTNTELEPDKTWVYEASLERRFWGDGAVVLTYTHGEITDAIDRVPVYVDTDGDTILDVSDPDDDNDGAADAVDPDDGDDAFDAPGNIGDGRRDEIVLNVTLPLDRFGVKGGEFKVASTFRFSEVTDPTTGEKRRISGERPQDVRFDFRQDLPERKMTWGVVALHGWDETYYRFNEIQRYHLPPPFLAVFTEWKPDPKTSLLVEASNLTRFEFNRKREVYEGPRDVAPLAFTEEMYTKSQVRFYVRLRRTFG
ncbi:MAG TPA: TonB-dependent receptor [Caulobacteraceae bacterium]|nr:TonB-dependent receptor [Caulobacteraceae bacterium]